MKKFIAVIMAVSLAVGLYVSCFSNTAIVLASNDRNETIKGLNHKAAYVGKKKSNAWSLSKLKKSIKAGKNVKGKVVKVKIKDITSLYDFDADNEISFVYYYDYEIPEIVKGDTIYAKVKMTQKLKLNNGETIWVVAYVLADGYDNPDIVYLSR